ncbi:MAG: metalloregulator ArsR/SmtB family transcription factor [Desulfohalobiaceae bacterium]
MDREEMIAALKALAHGTRWRMLELLLRHSLCVGALAQTLGVTEAAASQHLQVLRKANLVLGEKRGYWTHYLVREEALRRLGQDVTELPDREAGLRDLNEELSSGIHEKNGSKGRE